MAVGIFWVSLSLLAFTYAGYPLLLALLAATRPPITKAAITCTAQPEVTVVIAAHNEAERIVQRIENLLASDYPPEKLSVVVVSDGSTDSTLERITALNDPRIRAISLDQRKGKPAAINAGVNITSSELVVFTDTRQAFDPDTISILASHFSDPQIGAVSGELEIASAQSGTGAGVDAYWKLERLIRRLESRWDSCIGCTGACYAIRRALYEPLPEDTLVDDVVTPMRIAIAGKRVIHDPSAHAFDPQPLEPAAETRRKQRTLAGNFQMLFRHPSWLLPWRNRLWWQLAVHKYLRLAGPLLLASALAASATLANRPFYRVALLLQVVFYLLAALGMATPLRHRFLSLPAGFVFLNFTVIRAFWHYLTSADLARWQTAPR